MSNAEKSDSDLAITIKQMITSVLISSPLKLTIHRFTNDFRTIIGDDIPYRELGYKSLYDYLKSIPDTVMVKGHGIHAEIQPIIKETNKHINQLVSKQRVDGVSKNKRRSDKPPTPPIPSLLDLPTVKFPIYQQLERHRKSQHTTHLTTNKQIKSKKLPLLIRKNMEKLANMHPNGISAEQLTDEYKKVFQSTLDYTDYGYNSIDELCRNLNGINMKKSIKNDHINNQSIDNFDLPIISDDIFTVGKIDSDYHRYHLGEKFEVFITDIYGPDKLFGFNRATFDDFRLELHGFYAKFGDKWKFPKIYLTRHSYCVVDYKQYNRGLILDINDKIKVLLIDYGSIIIVDKKQIYYLLKKFAKKNAQALHLKLYDFQLNDHGELPMNFVEKLKKIVRNGNEIYAKIMQISTNLILNVELEVHSRTIINESLF